MLRRRERRAASDWQTEEIIYTNHRKCQRRARGHLSASTDTHAGSSFALSEEREEPRGERVGWVVYGGAVIG